MPNWCENRIEISGPAEAIARFKEAAQRVECGETCVFCLQPLFPTPQDLLDTVSGFLGVGTPEQAALEAQEHKNLSAYGFKNWYGWRLSNWGTKWDVNVKEWSSEEPTYLQAFFDSAWSPPVAAISHIATDFPELTFRLVYAEGGCDFSGGLEVTGEDVSDWSGSYRDRDECLGYDEEEEVETDEESQEEIA